MENKIGALPPDLRELAKQHLVLLESQNKKRKRDTVQLNLSGYSGVMFLIADIVKVCMLALDAGEDGSIARIPEPSLNISGVLGIVLDLIPYEEAELLDKIREGVLDQQPVDQEAMEEDFLMERYFLTPTADLDEGGGVEAI